MNKLNQLIFKYLVKRSLKNHQQLNNICLSIETIGSIVNITYIMPSITFSCRYINLYGHEREFSDNFKSFLINHNIKEKDYQTLRNTFLRHLIKFDLIGTNVLFVEFKENYINIKINETQHKKPDILENQNLNNF